jgi:hypothetical protein
MIKGDELYQVNPDTLLCFFDVIECCFYRNMIFLTTRQNLIKYLPRLINDSEFNIKRNPKLINGVRLLQLLISDAFLFLNELFFQNNHWNEYTRNYSLHAENDILFMQNIEHGSIYEMSLLDAVENSSTMDSKEKEKRISPFFEQDSLQVLLETNPDLLSRAILLLIQNNIDDVANPEMLKYFCEGCYQQLTSMGIGYFGFNATVNTIKIAKATKNEIFLNKITHILQRQLFEERQEFFSYMIYCYPTFIANLIDVMPEIFSGTYSNMFDPFFFKKHGYIKKEKLLDFIRIFRFLYENENIKSEKYRDGIRDLLRYFQETINRAINFSDIDFEKLTFMQLKTLLWYADIVKLPELSDKIGKILAQLQLLQKM